MPLSLCFLFLLLAVQPPYICVNNPPNYHHFLHLLHHNRSKPFANVVYHYAFGSKIMHKLYGVDFVFYTVYS